MNTIIYTKTNCPWAVEALDFLTKNKIPFEERDILKHPPYKVEVETATGQDKSPTLKVGSVWVCDAGVEDIAKAFGLSA